MGASCDPIWVVTVSLTPMWHVETWNLHVGRLLLAAHDLDNFSKSVVAESFEADLVAIVLY